MANAQVARLGIVLGRVLLLGEQAVEEVEPGLRLTGGQASGGLQGGQPVQCRPGDLRPGAVDVRERGTDAGERGTPPA